MFSIFLFKFRDHSSREEQTITGCYRYSNSPLWGNCFLSISTHTAVQDLAYIIPLNLFLWGILENKTNVVVALQKVFIFSFSNRSGWIFHFGFFDLYLSAGWVRQVQDNLQQNKSSAIFRWSQIGTELVIHNPGATFLNCFIYPSDLVNIFAWIT